MRFLVMVAIGLGANGCGKKCLEYDPGPGCDLVFQCCTESGDDCHYEARSGKTYECAGGALNCLDATERMLCDVCGEGWETLLDCKGGGGGGGGGGDRVTCNDGTKSSCSTCTEDCCTEHGGCEP